MVDSPLQIGGPGKFSVREDLPPSQNYGDRKAMAEDIAGAPTTAKPSATPAPAADIRAAAANQQPLTPLFADSARPGEDIMAGNRLGPGPGPEVLGMRPQQESLSQILATMLPYDTNGEIAALYEQAQSRGL
jgi:hypothetical protein